MADWRETILKEFVPQVARLTLVADPDHLLVEEVMQQGLRDRGFEVICFEESLAFRFAYEAKFRAVWDQGESCALVVILAGDASALKELPFDLWQTGRKLSFGLAALFPGLSYPVVAALDRGDLELLYQARELYLGETLGENPTKDFLLRQLFQIAPELIRDNVGLLRLLLRRHYSGQRIPSVLDERLLRLLRQRGLFDEWDLEELIFNRPAFFGFLQERWPIFLKQILERLEGSPLLLPDEQVSAYGLRYSGPALLPFDHDDIRIYIDNLFLDGLLKPIPFAQAKLASLKWVLAGIHHDPESDRKRRLEGLLEKCRSQLPSVESRHREWQQFAQLWGSVSQLVHDPDHSTPPGLQETYRALRERLDGSFQQWMEKRFAGLSNLPPTMVHHLPREMAKSIEHGGKAALLVLDGLALEHWLTLREVLAEQRPRLAFQEESLFAWVPTLTSISRQAIFSGQPPLYFPNTLHTTQQEPILWQRFWDGHGVAAHQVGYAKGVDSMEAIAELVANPRLKVVGLVVDVIDKIMHGMELGSAGMHASVRQWAKQGFMAALLETLLGHGFQIFLTSDHGSVEAVGMGRPSEGVAAEVRGERCRIYSDKNLRNPVLASHPNTMPWSAPGLPEGCHPVLATGRSAFTTKGSRLVGHGGLALEEVIVPYVRLSQEGP